eukprot:CAMPEP_0184653104 /NCGR_PEP_ID=MMETSP0308-20130426/10849_1 /TAXON_ID=38269 /ORGANISM="Gloeochaete witrockiana, Strain SAG 46.84" /LENGTH=78 /DNA_ID=CAMNT_0027088405 /DNA_START=674 /DNA_END=910 /DNA_ORIENTATION=-
MRVTDSRDLARPSPFRAILEDIEHVPSISLPLSINHNPTSYGEDAAFFLETYTKYGNEDPIGCTSTDHWGLKRKGLRK